MELTDDNLYITYILESRTQTELMQIFNISRTSLQKKLRNAELTKFSDIPEEFETMYLKGLTYGELAEYFDVEESLIKSWRRRSGVRRVPYQKRTKEKGQTSCKQH